MIEETAVRVEISAARFASQSIFDILRLTVQEMCIRDSYTPVVLSGDSEIPGFETGGESVDKPWSASYERSESLDFSYTVNTDKIQLDTLEKVDGAGIELSLIHI